MGRESNRLMARAVSTRPFQSPGHCMISTGQRMSIGTDARCRDWSVHAVCLRLSSIGGMPSTARNHGQSRLRPVPTGNLPVPARERLGVDAAWRRCFNLVDIGFGASWTTPVGGFRPCRGPSGARTGSGAGHTIHGPMLNSLNSRKPPFRLDFWVRFN